MDAHLKLKAKTSVIGSASDFTYKWAIILVIGVLATWYLVADWNEENDTFVID